MKAVIYARYSSYNQQETSIEFQVEDCTKFAQSHKYNVVRVFADRAKSATTDNRPSFLEMIRYCETNEVDAVICWKHDRFARNRYDAALYKSRLKKAGTKLLYCRESNGTGAESVLIDSIFEGLSEFYSENLSANVKAGNRKAAEKYWTLGVKVFGLKTAPDKTYIPDPETAPIVLKVFEAYDKGMPIKDIISTYLHGWKYTRVETLLRNKKLMGTYDQYGVYAENVIPAVVPKDLFERVQSRLADKSHFLAPNAQPEVYLLSGKVFCGKCGDKFNGNSTRKKNGKIYRWYTCRKHKHGCDNKTVGKEWLENLVINELIKIVHSDTMIERICDEFMAAQANEDEFVDVYADRLLSLQKRKANIVQAIGLTGDMALVEELTSLSAQIAETEESLNRAKTAVFSRAEIKAFLLDFRNRPDTELWRRMLISTFLVGVWIYPDKIIIQTTCSTNGEPDADTAETIYEFGFDDTSPAKRSSAKLYYWIAIPVKIG